MVAMNTLTCADSTFRTTLTDMAIAIVLFIVLVGIGAVLGGRDSRIDDVCAAAGTSDERANPGAAGAAGRRPERDLDPLPPPGRMPIRSAGWPSSSIVPFRMALLLVAEPTARSWQPSPP